MEEVYEADQRFWISEKIKLSTLFSEFRELMCPKNVVLPEKGRPEKQKWDLAFKMMGRDGKRSDFEEMKECRPECLMHKELQKPITNVEEMKKWPCLFNSMGIVAEAKKLRTVVGRMEKFCDADLKYRGNIPVVGPPLYTKVDLKPYNEMVIHLRLYHPFKHLIEKKENRELPRFAQEVLVLGRQTLANIRDIIECRSDGAVCREVSEAPFGVDKMYKRAKVLYRSGFFYIESVFYNDGRDPCNHDLSAPIREWAAEQGLPSMTVARMENTRICDLSVRLGFPYVYVHQGDCEHLVVFSIARLLHSDDELMSAAYPMVTSIGVTKERYCNVCKSHIARWVTLDNEHCPYNPGYFCDSCFYSFNYVGCKKVCNFRAYCIRDTWKQ